MNIFSSGKRRIWIAVTLAVAAAGLTAAALAAPDLDFTPARRNLSQRPSQLSAHSDLALSPNGDWMVSTWVEDKDVYLRAASLAGGGWGAKLTAFDGSDLEYAYDAAVAVTDEAVAHLAYVVFEIEGITVTTDIRYKTYSIDQQQWTERPPLEGESDERFTWVDLALDDMGTTHMVWARYDQEMKNGAIYYYSTIIQEIAQESGDNRAPAIAWADGHAHIVWEESATHRIQYKRPPSETITLYASSFFPPGHPDVAAGAGRVFVAWEQCTDPTCKGQYNLVYNRSDDGGETWDPTPREVGTDKVSDMTAYNSEDVPVEVPEDLSDLQPSLALNEDGWPAVAWHADSSGGSGMGYAVYYNYALSGSVDAVNWLTRTVLSKMQPGMRGSAEVGVGKSSSEVQYLHTTYMQEQSGASWDIYYDSNAEEAGVLFISMSPQQATNILPDNPAHEFAATVSDTNGLPVEDMPVSFSIPETDVGAFGSSEKYTETTTDAQGKVTVTVSADCSGTATIRAWLDYDHSDTWETGEPWYTATKTWVEAADDGRVYLPLVLRNH